MLSGRANAADVGSCAQECGKGAFVQKCCAGITMWRTDYKGVKEREFTYLCVDQSVAAANINMNIGDMTANISCVDSGAKKLAMAVFSVLVAVFT